MVFPFAVDAFVCLVCFNRLLLPGTVLAIADADEDLVVLSDADGEMGFVALLLSDRIGESECAAVVSFCKCVVLLPKKFGWSKRDLFYDFVVYN